ncbi:MAG: 4Fe-4S dicluster domain-containing protein [Deltaproteobacteria bacterium]|nr:4Fe-4S dicluster domain-containing protein [Deltaproteobacteria bacterium]
MNFSRRSFLTGVAAAAGAAVLPKRRAEAKPASDAYATLIDLTKCDGCEGKESPLCGRACREANAAKFPEPDPTKIKDYWPQKMHEDWSGKRQVTDRLTPYNWLFVQTVEVPFEGGLRKVSIPRRCMHCDNPPCAKLCPFGAAKKTAEGPVHIEPDACFGGAKCRDVCPWKVPQRQAGVGVYTHLDPLPVGGGVMYKCDLCRDRLARGEKPACVGACPRQAVRIGRRRDIEEAARRLAAEYAGFVYGAEENGGTSTFYVSQVPFEAIDQALLAKAKDPAKVMRMHRPENVLERNGGLAALALAAPLIGVAGAFVTTMVRREKDAQK